MSSQESRQAYRDTTEAGREDTQVRAILRCLARIGAATSHEISKETGLTAYIVSKRRGYLLRCHLAQEQLPRRCKVTGFHARPIQVTDQGRSVVDGAPVPDAEPSRREHELLALEAAREVAKTWESIAVKPPGIQRLVDRIWNLDHQETRHRAGATVTREPWGSPRRGNLALRGIWLRRNGDEVRISDLNDPHLRSTIAWCRENHADPNEAPLFQLLQEQEARL